MLRTAGAMAERVLLWAIPASDLERSASIVRDGAAHRPRPPELIWAPLVRHGDAPQASILHVAVYASLNTAAAVRRGWGLDDARVEAVRRELVRGDVSAAAALVPAAAIEDLVFETWTRHRSPPSPAGSACRRWRCPGSIRQRLAITSAGPPRSRPCSPDNGRSRHRGSRRPAPPEPSTRTPPDRSKRCPTHRPSRLFVEAPARLRHHHAIEPVVLTPATARRMRSRLPDPPHNHLRRGHQQAPARRKL